MTRQQSCYLLREKQHCQKHRYCYPKKRDVRDTPPTAGFFSAIELHKSSGKQKGGEKQQPRPQGCEHRACARCTESGKKCERQAAGKRADSAQDR